MSITRAIITRRSPLTLNFNQITRLSSTQPTANSSSVKAANKTNEVDANPSILSLGTHKADSFERKMLVWTGKYKSAKDIPAYVNQDVMEKTRNRMRIKISNYMMVFTVFGCIIMIWSGKKAVENGESVTKMNLEWHKEYKDAALKQAELQKNK